MANEAILTQAPSTETRSLWSALTRLWAPTATPADVELGYESAHPWTLGEDAANDARPDSH